MYKREVSLSGHIIDSMILPTALDLIMEMGGDFKIIEFKVGKLKVDISHARILVEAPNETLLGEILAELSEIGALVVALKDVQLLSVEKDGTLPNDFYSTTHHQTHIRCKGVWIPVENIEMDCMIVVEPETQRAICKPIGRIKKGDLVVVGREGIQVLPPERPRGKKGVFEFMSSEASSEKPIHSIIQKIASEIQEVKKRNGKIIVVSGPAVVHTGSGPILAQMIKEGIIDVIFAGNALATHDIENALYGTSLGMCVKTGEAVTRGHRNHIYAINEINKAGSIKKPSKREF